MKMQIGTSEKKEREAAKKEISAAKIFKFARFAEQQQKPFIVCDTGADVDDSIRRRKKLRQLFFFASFCVDYKISPLLLTFI
jgi:hypothetical protein